MKKIIPFFIFILLVSSRIASQTPIDISEGTLDFGESTMPAFSVAIPEADYESTLEEWIDLLESGTKSKVVTDNGRMTIFGAKIKSLSDNPVNVFSSIEKEDSAVNLNVAIELEKDKYAGAGELTRLREYLMDFAKKRYLAVVDDELDREKKALRDLKKEVKSLDKNEAKDEKAVRKYNDLISSEEQKISEYNDRLSFISSDIARLETGGMGAPESELGTDALKDLEKEQKKMNREIRKSEKRIDRAERKIDNLEDDISEAYNDQYDARNDVSRQEAVVQRIEIKRDAIKNYR